MMYTPNWRFFSVPIVVLVARLLRATDQKSSLLVKTTLYIDGCKAEEMFLTNFMQSYRKNVEVKTFQEVFVCFPFLKCVFLLECDKKGTIYCQ